MSVSSMHHEPPAVAYLTSLAEELEPLGLPATVTGTGSMASLVFNDDAVTDKYGRVYYDDGITSRRAQFVWKSGGVIGPVSMPKLVAKSIRLVVNDQ